MSIVMIGNGERVWVGPVAPARPATGSDEPSDSPARMGDEAPNDARYAVAGHSTGRVVAAGAAGIALGALGFAAAHTLSQDPDLLAHAPDVQAVLAQMGRFVEHGYRVASALGANAVAQATPIVQKVVPPIQLAVMGGGALYARKVGAELVKTLKGEQKGADTVEELRRYHRELLEMVKGLGGAVGKVLGLGHETKSPKLPGP